MSGIFQQVDKALDRARMYIDDVVPEFSDVINNIKNDPKAMQKELQKYTQELNKNTRYYSKVQSDYINLRQLNYEVEHGKLSGRDKRKFRDRYEEYEKQFKHCTKVLKERIRNVKQIIESIRSLQSHSHSQPNF